MLVNLYFLLDHNTHCGSFKLGNLWRDKSHKNVRLCRLCSAPTIWASNWFCILGSLTPGSPPLPWPGQIPTDKGASPALHHPYYFPSAQQSKFYHSKSSSAVLSNIMLCYIFKACSSSPNSLEVEQYFILVSFPGVWSLPARCLNNSRQDNPPSINPPTPHRYLFQLLTALYQLSHGHHGSCPSSSRPHHVHHHTVCDSLSPGYSHSESKHRPACQQHCLVIVINVSFIIII